MKVFIKKAAPLATMGFKVFPAHGVIEGRCSCWRDCSSPGKHPILKDWSSKATTNVATLQQWQQNHPYANVGVKTGNGLFVLDIDRKSSGFHSLGKLEEKFGVLPQTFTVDTGGGGRHFYFQYPQQLEIKNAVNLLPGIDVRASGGLVIGPGSIHISGKPYQAFLHELAVIPHWLLKLATPSHNREMKTNRDEIFSPQITEGGRNQHAARVTGFLLRANVPATLTLSIMLGWNQAICRPPLPDREIKQVVSSIVKRELQRRSQGGVQ